ncbi:MAG TPA: hypothetical protein PLJ47_06595 [Candidatus Hydrogenedentes bacterium]|nr:hypothetical protein [Candidatus Hydrogenedentota bacterium]HRK34246.1 hypothetical protein [Candidatus Hydrogenedentota bacterium]
MPFDQLDRFKVLCKPLGERHNKVHIESDHVPATAAAKPLGERGDALIEETVAKLRKARDLGASRMLTFGAHSIKNGLAPVFTQLIERGWITHLATNGAGIIHDWEFAYQGHSSEDVRANVTRGEFGTWDETGFYINLAILVGAYHGLGYGESVGALVENEGLEIPSEAALLEAVHASIETDADRAAAAADLLTQVRAFELKGGWMAVPHPYKQYGLQGAAYRLGVPYTGHPMIGHDIIYVHPMNHCGAIGRASQRDFLYFAKNVSNLENGVYISIGSAVMSPMIFEKSLSMSQNIAIQQGKHIDNHYMMIVDLAESHWDWSKGEPPVDNPDYYLRYNKTFARMGGTMRYLSADNRDFLLTLLHRLEKE